MRRGSPRCSANPNPNPKPKPKPNLNPNPNPNPNPKPKPKPKPNPHQVLSLVFASGPLVSMLGPALGGILYGALGARF